MSQPVYADDLRKLLEQYRPRSILLLDPGGTELCTPYLNAHPDCRLEHIGAHPTMTDLPTAERYDICVVANTLERMQKVSGGQLIARLRDLLTQRLFIVVPAGDGWPDVENRWEMGDFIAFGMQLVADYDRDGRQLQMYKFDIGDYKLTPEWLNARHWAHPERWDKERW